MAAYHRVYDSRHLQADCQKPGSAPEPYDRQSSMGYLYFLPLHRATFALRFTSSRNETPQEGVNAPRRDTNGLWYVQSRDSLVVHQSSERSLRVTRQREAPRRRWCVVVAGEKPVDSCAENNGGCHHDCRHSSAGPVCTCHDGFRLLSDQKSCEGTVVDWLAAWRGG